MFSDKLIILVIVLELYWVVVLLWSILMFFKVVSGIVFILVFVVLVLIVLFKLKIDWLWWCLLLIRISVWFGCKFWRVVGLNKLELFDICVWEKLKEGVVVCRFWLSLVKLFLFKLLVLIKLIGDVDLVVVWLVICEFNIEICLIFLFVFMLDVCLVVCIEVVEIVILIVMVSIFKECVVMCILLIFWFFLN